MKLCPEAEICSHSQELRSVPCSKPIEQEHVDRALEYLERERVGFVQIYIKILKIWLNVLLTDNLKASTVSGPRILCLGRSPFLVSLFPFHLVKYYSITIRSHKFFFFKKHILYVFCLRACL